MSMASEVGVTPQLVCSEKLSAVKGMTNCAQSGSGLAPEQVPAPAAHNVRARVSSAPQASVLEKEAMLTRATENLQVKMKDLLEHHNRCQGSLYTPR